MSHRYPSLLESSDVAGGSTAAVLTYLCHILVSIDQGELVHRILHFLLASSPPPENQTDMSASRRKSLNVLAALASEAAQPSPSLFNLRDLVLLGLQSTNRQTVLATLRLLNVVLQRHHSFARALIHTMPSQPSRQRSVGAFNAELEQLLTLGTSLLNDPTLDESYDNYVADATWVLESRLCLPVSTAEAENGMPLPLQLQQDDPIVQGLLGCLETFFTNSVIVNLALTGSLMSLASSHLFSLDGWVLVDPLHYEPSSQGPCDGVEQVSRAYHTPASPPMAKPTLTVALGRLVEKVHQWRQDVPDFDILVAERRELLQLGGSAHTPTRPQEPSETPASASMDRSRLSRPTSPESTTLDSRGRPVHPTTSPAVGLPGESSVRPAERRDSSMAREDGLRQRLAMPFPPIATASPSPDSAEPTGLPATTLGHILTNVVILYEFLLELSAVVQARGSLFEETGYN